MTFYCFRILASFEGRCCIKLAHIRMGFLLWPLEAHRVIRAARGLFKPRVFFLNEQQELPRSKRRGRRG